MAGAELRPERFAQLGVEGLRRGIDRVERERLTTRDRTRKQDATAAALAHALDERVGQDERRLAVHGHEATEPFPVEEIETAGVAEARVVHEQTDLEFGDRLGERRCAAGFGEIGGHHAGLDSVFALELRGDPSRRLASGAQTAFTSSVMICRAGGADSGGGPGHERPVAGAGRSASGFDRSSPDGSRTPS